MNRRLVPICIDYFVRSNRAICLQNVRHRSNDAWVKDREKNEEGFTFGCDKDMAYNHVPKKNGLLKPKHTVEEQIQYMESEVFKKTYQGKPIYLWYKRNIRGQWVFQPPPRLFCIDKNGRFNLNNACPVCRDEYLFFDYRNPKLIEIFLSWGTVKPMPIKKTGLCQEQYIMLQAQLLKAQEYGTIPFAVDFRQFNYADWYPDWKPAPSIEGEDDPQEEHLLSRDSVHVDDIYPNPEIYFPAHNREIYTDWDQWWLRHEKFARKGK